MSSISQFITYLYYWIYTSYILHKKLNKILQEPCWPFVSFWNLRLLYFYHSLPFAVTHCHLLSLIIRCHSIYHFLSFVATRFITLCRYLSLVVPLLIIRCTTHWHSLSLIVPLFVTLACLFLNNPSWPLELRINLKF